MPRIWTIGYERLLPAELVAELQAAGVERLIDVRYRPQSRRPGMSKTRLGELLADHGIAYEHRKPLGTPPDIRWFYKHDRTAEGAPKFREHIEKTAAHELDDLAAELDRGPRTRADVPGGRPRDLPPPHATEALSAPPGPRSGRSLGSEGWRGRQHYGVTLALLTVAGVSFAIMQTLVIPALPFFQREFDTSASWVTWIATGFLLSSSVLTPILGKLGDAYGKKRMLVISLGDLRARVARPRPPPGTSPSLIFFRVLQGAGRGRLPALASGSSATSSRPRRSASAIGTVSSVFGVGGGVGLVLSGVIIEHLTWHWLFLIGAMPVLASTVLLALFVPESPVKFPTRPDYVGGADAVGRARHAAGRDQRGQQLGLDVGRRARPARARRRPCSRCGSGSSSACPSRSWTCETFARREMAATNLTTLIMGFSMFSTFILLPNFVQNPLGLPPEIAAQLDYGFGASPVEAGLFFVPSSVAMMIAGPLAGALGQRYGRVLPLRIGLGFLVLSR